MYQITKCDNVNQIDIKQELCIIQTEAQDITVAGQVKY